MNIRLKNAGAAFARARYRALIAFALVAIQSALFLYLSSYARVTVDVVISTSVLCFIATVIGILILENIRRYPGVEEFSYIIPALIVSYSCLIVVFIMLRLPYSRLMILSTFFINIGGFFILHVFMRRRTRLRIGIVAEGEYQRLADIPGIDWYIFPDANAPIDGLDAVSADLWRDLSDKWERRLASFALLGLPVYHAKHLCESLTGKVEVERLSENNFGTLSPLYAYMGIKHLADWLIALVAIVVLFPAFLVVAIVIKLDSPGPVIFRQTRIGYQGRPFQVFKFRTMTEARQFGEASSERDAAMTKDGDQRITRVGRFLRRTRIDELPQVWNILRGEMSWIGPRPEAEVLSRWYEAEIPFYRYRHIVRPGITGWAQVHQGHVADVDQVREKLHYDFYYIKNFSPWIDFIIVARTIKTLLTGFGSR
jgi:lipopolysaccharide/colanic/teichoic acid biosynthesis glycosyltransferase